MKSGHDNIKEMLPEYLEGSLAEEMRKEIEGHLRDCPDCRSELSLITELVNIDVPDPGGLFWKTLPRKVMGTVERERADRFSLKTLLFGRLPLAAAIAISFFLIVTFAIKEKTMVPDPSFKDPFLAEVLDYSDLSEKDIPGITEQLTADELYLQSESLPEYSYYREFASLSSKEMESLYEALKKEQQTGGYDAEKYI